MGLKEARTHPESIPQKVRGEMLAINTTHGAGTWKLEAAFSKNGKSYIRTCLRLPCQVKLNVLLPGTYPQEQPAFQPVEIARWNKLPTRERNICLITFFAVSSVFQPHTVCMQETIEAVEKRIAFIDDAGKVVNWNLWLTPELKKELRWTKSRNIDATELTKQETCPICFDECLASSMVPLPCGCHYCSES